MDCIFSVVALNLEGLCLVSANTGYGGMPVAAIHLGVPNQPITPPFCVYSKLLETQLKLLTVVLKTLDHC